MKLESWIGTFALGLLAACGGGGGGAGNAGPGSLEVLATDSPFAHEIVESADIWVREVRIRGGGEFTTLYDGPAVQLDLANLRNGLVRQLVQADLPAGSYDELRLTVERSRLELVDGDVFDSDLGSMNLTSTATAGLQLEIDPPLQVSSGVARTLLLDFDLTKTFHAVPGADPLNASSYNLMPHVWVSVMSETGELRGVVREDDGSGGLVGVADVTVYLLAPGELDPQNALRSTATEADGSYALIGVMPGTYDVLAELGTRQARLDGEQVFLGSVSTVDFVLP
ncbi:MAG: DUF4382 domain-containing protein [Planctomycetaceae bacterium]|nr:DUF4382 domain-containing protein [Planctomycetaceae bacterium]